jgi:hypothetical protein
MDTSSRRAVLEGIAFGADVSGHERLRALELLDRLDDRETPHVTTPPSDEELASDADRLAQAVGLILDLGLADERIEAIVEQRTAERLRERFAVVSAETTDEPSVAPEEASESQRDPEPEPPQVHPLDERVFELLRHDEAPAKPRSPLDPVQWRC